VTPEGRPAPPDPFTPLGLTGLAELGGKSYQAAWRWWDRTQRGTARDPLPPPDGSDAGRPIWLFATVQAALLRAGWITPAEHGRQPATSLTWMAGRHLPTGRGFLADSAGGRFDFDIDPDNLEALKGALDELLFEEGRSQHDAIQ
jgi:hypothetical protein